MKYAYGHSLERSCKDVTVEEGGAASSGAVPARYIVLLGFRCRAACKGVGSLIQHFQPKEFVVVLNNITSLDMYINAQAVCGYLFIALPLSVKTGVLGRLLLLIHPPRINE